MFFRSPGSWAPAVRRRTARDSNICKAATLRLLWTAPRGALASWLIPPPVLLLHARRQVAHARAAGAADHPHRPPGTRDADTARPPVRSGRHCDHVAINSLSLPVGVEGPSAMAPAGSQGRAGPGSRTSVSGQNWVVPQARLPEFGLVVAAHRTRQLMQLRVGGGEVAGNEGSFSNTAASGPTARCQAATVRMVSSGALACRPAHVSGR